MTTCTRYNDQITIDVESGDGVWLNVTQIDCVSQWPLSNFPNGTFGFMSFAEVCYSGVDPENGGINTMAFWGVMMNGKLKRAAAMLCTERYE